MLSGSVPLKMNQINIFESQKTKKKLDKNFYRGSCEKRHLGLVFETEESIPFSGGAKRGKQIDFCHNLKDQVLVILSVHSSILCTRLKLCASGLCF